MPMDIECQHMEKLEKRRMRLLLACLKMEESELETRVPTGEMHLPDKSKVIPLAAFFLL